MRILETKITGVTFIDEDADAGCGNCPQNIQELSVGDGVTLKSYHFKKVGCPEDPFAVKVTRQGKTLGHIPKGNNRSLSHKPCVSCTVKHLHRRDENGHTDDPNAEVVGVVLQIVTNDTATETITSFTDGRELTFFPNPVHEVWDGSTKLKGVTKALDCMYKPFPKDIIAPKSAKKFGLKTEEILKLWDGKAEGGSGFGTVMHNYLEMYETYRYTSMPEEKYLPNLKPLADIVKSFDWEKWGGVKPVIVEPLISVKDRAGFVDRLVSHEFSDLLGDGVIYRVEDYKFYADAEKLESKYKNSMFPSMPNNKITKGILQMSVYSDMLELNGFEVSDDVVLHVWDGKWTAYAEKRIPNIIEIIEKEG